jgi:cell division protein FtsB
MPPARPAAAQTPSLRKRLLLILALCATLAMAARAVLGERGLFEVWRKKSAYAQLLSEVQALRQENIQLNRETQSLRSESLAIERIAREQLGYSRPGEVTFVFREDPGTQAAATP